MNNYKRTEKAQVLYIIAIGLVALLGFAALAIDGGAIYAERRRAYNAADTASLTGALTLAEAGGGNPCNAIAAQSQAISDALARASANQYDNSDPDVVVTTAVDRFNDANCPDAGVNVYYTFTVEITSTLPTYFAHFVFNGPLRTTVKAIAKAHPIQNIAFGYSVIGTSKTDCNTIWFHGTQAMEITGGGVYSNSDGKGGTCGGGKANGTPDVTVTDGGISAVGSWDISGSPVLVPPPTSGAAQITFPPIPVPVCDGLENRGSVTVNGNTTIEPGIYGSIRLNTGTLTMNPGLYCIYGAGGFTTQGGTVESDPNNGVTIYLRDGSFDIGGNTVVHLYAPTDLLDPAGQQWAGMLIYMDESNTGLVRISGTTTTNYRGTIYAPGPPSPLSQPKCSVLGTGEAIGVESQIICYTVELGGTADLELHYDKSQNFNLPAEIELLE